MNKVADNLRASADVFEERGRVYGDAYKNFGHVLMALRPSGFAIRNVEDANRLGVFTQIVSKIVRYANQFEAGGHDDSLLDLSTYAAMLRELDAEGRARFEAPFPFELTPGPFHPKPGREPSASFPVGDSVVPRGEGFRVGEIEPAPEKREPTYFRADAEKRWAAENGEPLSYGVRDGYDMVRE